MIFALSLSLSLFPTLKGLDARVPQAAWRTAEERITQLQLAASRAGEEAAAQAAAAQVRCCSRLMLFSDGASPLTASLVRFMVSFAHCCVRYVLQGCCAFLYQLVNRYFDTVYTAVRRMPSRHCTCRWRWAAPMTKPAAGRQRQRRRLRSCHLRRYAAGLWRPMARGTGADCRPMSCWRVQYRQGRHAALMYMCMHDVQQLASVQFQHAPHALIQSLPLPAAAGRCEGEGCHAGQCQ